MNALDNPDKNWLENFPRGWAANSATVLSIKSGIDTEIALHAVHQDAIRNVFLINLGRNDPIPATDSTTWSNNYRYIIDAIIVKWSDAEIYLAYPWSVSTNAAADIMATWINAIIADYPGRCYAGHDERVWLKGADNGATMTYDGTHYSAAGQAECANQWKTILGY